MDKSVNYSLTKKLLLIFSLIINITLLMLMVFLWPFWIYLIISGVTFIAMFVLLSLNRYVYNKILWLLMATAFPAFGLTLYFLNKHTHRYFKERKIYQDLQFRSKDTMEEKDDVFKPLKKQSISQYKMSQFLENYLGAELHNDSVTKFLRNGDEIFGELFNELKQAKKYILIEQYLIREGRIWDSLFEILKQKAREGVEIKLLYDPLGCKKAFSDKLTFKKLANYKIECMPYKNGVFGFGNHRKIIVIDGVIGFVGGANISDRYIQLKDENSDNWEQSGLKITGEAVFDMAVMFLNDWQFSKGKINGDTINYRPDKTLKLKTNEFVHTFYTSPLSCKEETREVLTNLIANSDIKVDIISSYIEIDNFLYSTLRQAVQGGVEVSIITSSVSDKPSMFAVSRAYYADLIKAGVKIYEYSGGFIRTKMMCLDGSSVVVGSMNLDCRRLDAKFENAVLVHSKDLAKQVSEEIDDIKANSILYSLKDAQSLSLGQRVKGALLKFLKF